MGEIATDAGSEQMARISPENRTHVTFSAEVDVSELSIPRKQWIAGRAKSYEELFCAEVFRQGGRTSAHLTPDKDRYWGGSQPRPQTDCDKLVISKVAYVGHLDGDETERVIEAAREIEERFRDEALEYADPL